MKYCVDTNTIGVLTSKNPHLPLLQRVAEQRDEIALPAMVVSEWLFGIQTIREPFRAKLLEAAQAFLEARTVIPFEREDALLDTLNRYKLQIPKMNVDGMIAAMALRRGLIVVTANRKHFAPFEQLGLQVETW